MSGSGSNLFDGLPAGVDEAALLAWVEGERLPREQELAVARFLESRPLAARALEAMRTDRAGIVSMPGARAPADLLERVRPLVQPMVERQMLLEPGEGASTRPALRIVGQRRSSLRALMADHRGRAVLAAAAVLVLTGVGVYFGAQSLSGGRTVGRVAQAEVPTRSEQEFAPPKPSAGDSLRVADADVRGEKSVSQDPLAGLAMAAAQEATPAVARALSIDDLIAEEQSRRDRGEITPSLATDLARRGELVVRIRTDQPGVDAQAVLARVAAATRDGPHRPFELEEPGVDALEFVEAGNVAELMGPPAPGRSSWRAWGTAEAAPAEPRLFVVSAPLDAAALSALRYALGDAGEVILERADRPLGLLHVAAGAPDRAALPVVIELPRSR